MLALRLAHAAARCLLLLPLLLPLLLLLLLGWLCVRLGSARQARRTETKAR